MGLVIGNGIVIPHIIKRVRIVREVGAIIGGMLRHFLVFAARTVVEDGLVSMVGWRCSGQLQNWGLVVEKWGLPRQASVQY